MNSNRTLTILGTGNALATRCYNTCFLLQDGDTRLLVDAGGGNGILTQLERAGVALQDIHHLFITHAHTDHLLGCIWVVRLVAQLIGREWYEGQLHVYSHHRALSVLHQCCQLMLPEKDFAHIGQEIIFEENTDGKQFSIGTIRLTAFDIHSTKEQQFGFRATMSDGTTVVCLGDEPFNELCRPYAENADWLLSEAFCLYQDREHFQPYEKHHGTVIDTARVAESLKAKNLVIYHTEDRHLDTRHEAYTQEAAKAFTGRIFVPDDLDQIYLANRIVSV